MVEVETFFLTWCPSMNLVGTAVELSFPSPWPAIDGARNVTTGASHLHRDLLRFNWVLIQHNTNGPAVFRPKFLSFHSTGFKYFIAIYPKPMFVFDKLTDWHFTCILGCCSVSKQRPNIFCLCFLWLHSGWSRPSARRGSFIKKRWHIRCKSWID